MRTHLLGLSVVSMCLAAACGGEEKHGKSSCDPVANTGCGPDLTCETVTGGGSMCAPPVVVRGAVFDLADQGPIEAARVMAFDVNGAPVSSVGVTDKDGNYELQIPHERSKDGAPVARSVTLRADAATFQTFPEGIRQAVPLETTGATKDDGKLVVQSTLTDIGLIELPADAGTGSISGHVDLPEGRPGVLVVAELDGKGASAVADRDGSYQIFNLKPGQYTVTGYTKGSSFESATATVDEGTDSHLDLARSDARTGRISGKVSIVNRGEGTTTSVILAVESLFDAAIARGESPPGLRVDNVDGSFSIDGVAAGKYVVLASFENDHLVRDPDTSIGGTSIIHQTLAAGQDLALAESFKVTGALDFLPPLGLATVGVTEAPVISWKDDSSEDGYDLTVYDALGQVAWNWHEDPHSGDDPSVTYGGPLEPGMYYQVKIQSMKDGTPISATEDLAGIFFAQ